MARFTFREAWVSIDPLKKVIKYPGRIPCHTALSIKVRSTCKRIYLCGLKTCHNKTVLLRERKRHTARRVVSTPSVVLTGYPPHPDLAGGVPCWGVPYLGEYPARGVPCPGGTLPGYPPSWPGGYPARGVPCPGGTLLGYPCPGPEGYPAGGYLPGYPPSWPGGTLLGVPYLGTPRPDLAGYPSPPGWTWLGTTIDTMLNSNGLRKAKCKHSLKSMTYKVHNNFSRPKFNITTL